MGREWECARSDARQRPTPKSRAAALIARLLMAASVISVPDSQCPQEIQYWPVQGRGGGGRREGGREGGGRGLGGGAGGVRWACI